VPTRPRAQDGGWLDRNLLNPLEFRFCPSPWRGSWQNNYRSETTHVRSSGHRRKQYRVAQGETLRVEKLDAEAGKEITFDNILMLGDGDGVRVGDAVKGATVTAKVIGHGRSEKVRIIKFRRRKHHMKRQGHRQHYTEIQITGISAGGQK